uniref:PDZ domain-containing protein n=1 Tax=Arion vulgaris TaxID=1028688 RepID=A0A0B7A089_9EUPU
MSEDVPEQYRPRLSHVVKWEDFQGYGFNLHAEKGKAGQFIGKVDAHSPAEAAGLKEGDRIVEVNGVNIGNENHQQVVTRIKSGGEETRLLVVDTESDDWYKDNKKIVRGDLPEVRIISSKRDNDDEVTGQGQDDDRDEQREDSHHESDVEDIVGSGSSAVVHNGNRHVNEDDSYRPRLCHLKLWQHFQGYGFNLHAERDKPGQYIGLVDDNSPASTAGLKVHDRIIEVNGVNIEKEKHSDVIGRIKAIPGETKLLVVDKRVDDYYREKGVSITSSLPQTDYTITPDAADVVNGLKSSVHVQPAASEPEHEFTVAQHVHQEKAAASSAPVSKEAEGLELHLSVAEMKERLKSKKRQDPRMNKVSFEQKYKEFQRM